MCGKASEFAHCIIILKPASLLCRVFSIQTCGNTTTNDFLSQLTCSMAVHQPSSLRQERVGVKIEIAVPERFTVVHDGNALLLCSIWRECRRSFYILQACGVACLLWVPMSLLGAWCWVQSSPHPSSHSVSLTIYKGNRCNL